MKLDIIYTYYNGQDILEDYLYNWSNNFKDTKHDINFIIVDDHSEKKAIDIVSKFDVQCNLQVYYVEDDIIWNESGARNLGVSKSTSDIMLVIDWDGVVYEDLIKEIFTWEFNNEVYYSLKCLGVAGFNPWYFIPRFDVRRNKIIYKSHHSTFCLTKTLWDEAGGFDEDFAGNYGWADILFDKNLQYLGKKKKCINTNFLLLNETGSSVNVNRNTKINTKLLHKKMPDPKKNKPGVLPTNPLRFNYTKQYINMIS